MKKVIEKILKLIGENQGKYHLHLVDLQLSNEKVFFEFVRQQKGGDKQTRTCTLNSDTNPNKGNYYLIDKSFLSSLEIKIQSLFNKLSSKQANINFLEEKLSNATPTTVNVHNEIIDPEDKYGYKNLCILEEKYIQLISGSNTVYVPIEFSRLFISIISKLFDYEKARSIWKWNEVEIEKVKYLEFKRRK